MVSWASEPLRANETGDLVLLHRSSRSAGGSLFVGPFPPSLAICLIEAIRALLAAAAGRVSGGVHPLVSPTSPSLCMEDFPPLPVALGPGVLVCALVG